MPTHNRVELLKKAINSVLAQSYQNFKLVIVNDGSSDGTQAYLESLKDPRISFIEHKSPMGACRSRNDAIDFLDTELVTGLDDDDTFLPERLTELLSVYDDNYSFVCSGYYWDYGTYKKPLFKGNREITLSDAFDLNQCSNQILVNRKRVIDIGGFDVSLPALQDYDLWIRLISNYGTAYRLGKPLYIVNSDQNIEHISSVDNKMKAIAIFSKKHEKLMLKRNKENFEFYKKKINGDKFSFLNLLTSIKYGLFNLKLRLFFSRYFKRISTIRLKYLQSGGLLHLLKSEIKDLLSSNCIHVTIVLILLFLTFYFY
ncbi:glycosyltransferase [Litorilituus lipolyticus]|nr:glycosyltransferase [Litorilituus lipolyticus]